jgi:hypothetical protein
VAPVALGLNGNAITVSQALFEALRQEAQGEVADPRVTAKAPCHDRGKAPPVRGSPVDIRPCVSFFPVIITNCGYGCGLAISTPMRTSSSSSCRRRSWSGPCARASWTGFASASRGIRWPSRPALGPSSIKARISSATARKRSWLSGPNGRGRMGTTSAPSRAARRRHKKGFGRRSRYRSRTVRRARPSRRFRGLRGRHKVECGTRPRSRACGQWRDYGR